MTEQFTSNPCWECNKPATLRCPTCLKLNLPPATYCSQDCFKKSWPTHKLLHTIKPSSIPENPDKSSWPQWLKERSEFTGFKFMCNIRPRKVTPKREVLATIEVPDYANDPEGRSLLEENCPDGIYVNNDYDIAMIRKACELGVIVLETAGQAAKVNVTTDEIDRIVHEKCMELGVYPSPLNYGKFPKSCCTSVNEVICHGIPDMRRLEDGDILNVDISVFYKGYHSDLNETYLIGDVKKIHQDLLKVTYDSLEKSIGICHPGRMYRDIGDVIDSTVRKSGFSIVRSYCGHGVGKLFHYRHNIPHYRNNKAIGVMKAGHVFTIEPMINEASWKDHLWGPDNWTSTTIDTGYSAQFEHTILITPDGHEVLTRRRWGSYIERFLDQNGNPTSVPQDKIRNWDDFKKDKK